MMVSTMIPARHHHDADLEAALAFVNTLAYERGEPEEGLATASDAQAWLVERGLLHEDARAMPGPASLRRLRRLRGALRELVEASHAGRAADAAALATVNGALHTREILELVADADGLRLEHRHGRDPLGEALAHLAEPIVQEIGAGLTERLRPCADDGCRWLFYDASRQGRRRWCDMTSCGNRAKAARHRARLKAEAGASGGSAA